MQKIVRINNEIKGINYSVDDTQCVHYSNGTTTIGVRRIFSRGLQNSFSRGSI